MVYAVAIVLRAVLHLDGTQFTGVAVRMGRKVPPAVLGTLEDDPVADVLGIEAVVVAK